MARSSSAELLSFEHEQQSQPQRQPYEQEDSRLPRPGTLVAGRYELGTMLGDGGMSTVYRAWDRRLRREVAFKLLNPKLASFPDIVARFVNEARTLARLGCPHIVQVFDAGVMSESQELTLPFMVLEYLKGAELRSVAQRGVYEDQRVIGWMLEVCEGLAAAHGEGIIHRDLKPENLFLVTEPDGSERIKILDFGIARSLKLDFGLTLEGEGVGSPGYMSPEQLRDASSVDQRSDIWSLGVVMYELLARESPFRANSALELCTQILNSPIRPLHELRPDLPVELCAIVDRCLERDIDVRYPNILALAEALQPFARPSGVVPSARIRRRLNPRLKVVEYAGDADSGQSDREVDELFTTTNDVASDVRLKKLERRVFIARTIAILIILGLLTLIAVAVFPDLPRLAREFALESGERVQRGAQKLLGP